MRYRTWILFLVLGGCGLQEPRSPAEIALEAAAPDEYRAWVAAVAAEEAALAEVSYEEIEDRENVRARSLKRVEEAEAARNATVEEAELEWEAVYRSGERFHALLQIVCDRYWNEPGEIESARRRGTPWSLESIERCEERRVALHKRNGAVDAADGTFEAEVERATRAFEDTWNPRLGALETAAKAVLAAEDRLRRTAPDAWNAFEAVP